MKVLNNSKTMNFLLRDQNSSHNDLDTKHQYSIKCQCIYTLVINHVLKNSKVRNCQYMIAENIRVRGWSYLVPVAAYRIIGSHCWRAPYWDKTIIQCF